jgi:hypothetical protein
MFRPKTMMKAHPGAFRKAQGRGMPFLFFKSTCYLNGGMWSLPRTVIRCSFIMSQTNKDQPTGRLDRYAHEPPEASFKSTCCCGGMWSHLDSVTLSIAQVLEQTDKPQHTMGYSFSAPSGPHTAHGGHVEPSQNGATPFFNKIQTNSDRKEVFRPRHTSIFYILSTCYLFWWYKEPHPAVLRCCLHKSHDQLRRQIRS